MFGLLRPVLQTISRNCPLSFTVRMLMFRVTKKELGPVNICIAISAEG